MNDEKWEKAKEIFGAAIRLAPERRLSYLAEICGEDTEIHDEVASLLASHEATDFLDRPAVGEVAAEILNLEIKGRRFGHYEIIEQISAGGMGEVYLAEDTRLGRPVAVKILNDRFAVHESNRGRFFKEAKAAAALNHPNILVVHEFGEDADTLYLVSEYIEGESLGDLLRKKRIDLDEILSISIQVAGALGAAHEARLVHRDIKPDNVMVRADKIVKVLDFGLAKLIEPPAIGDESTKAADEPDLTAKGIILGTASYMSPEQARGLALDARTDIFSFGCVLYEMLAGRKAFAGETVNHTIVAVLEKEPPPLEEFFKNCPADIERIVGKCLAKNPNNRYSTAKELLAELQTAQKRLELATAERRAAPDATGAEPLAPTQPFKLDATQAAFAPTPHNLSENPSPIVGREKEIAEIVNLLKNPAQRLLTLTGVGGTGKTRLAQEIARAALNDFPDGVFFIELAEVTSSEAAAPAIAQPLGIREYGGRPLIELLRDNLRDRKILLVLDNFEQIADGAPLVGELLSAARLKILITSRTLLRLSREHEFVVPPLHAPAENGELSLAEIAGYDAVRLFAERARKAKQIFELTADNAAAVAEICRRLDGLPLAIELAAARMKIFSAHEILARLENRLRLLTGGARDLPLRQQTMRGTLEWSYGLLSDAEKTLFRQLAVFAGGFTYEAAEAVCRGAADDAALASTNVSANFSADFSMSDSPNDSADDFIDLLTSLVDKSLVVAKEQAATGETRFRMLEVVRQYALELLEASGEAETLRRRHFTEFLVFGEKAEKEMLGAGGVRWLNRLEEDHENLRSALDWSLAAEPTRAARLAGAIRNFWTLHCHFREGRRLCAAALEMGGDAIDAGVRFKLLNALGAFARQQGDDRAAEKAYAQGLAEGKAANDLRQIAHADRGLGLVSFQRGDLGASRKYMEESLRVLRELQDEFNIALTLTSLGDLERAEGNTAAARPLFEESLEICRKLDNKGASCCNLTNLGAVNYEEGDLAASFLYYAVSLATARELEDKSIISLCLDGFAALALKRGETARAARIAGAAERLRERIGYETEPTDGRFRDAFLAELKTALDEKDFEDFYEQGRKLKLAEAIALTESSDSAESSENADS